MIRQLTAAEFVTAANAILDDPAKRRCVDAKGTCYFYAPEQPWGCAVGRLLPEQLRRRLPNNTLHDIYNDYPSFKAVVDEMLPHPQGVSPMPKSVEQQPG